MKSTLCHKMLSLLNCFRYIRIEQLGTFWMLLNNHLISSNQYFCLIESFTQMRTSKHFQILTSNMQFKRKLYKLIWKIFRNFIVL